MEGAAVSFDPVMLALGILLGTIGFALFRHGRAQTKVVELIAGIILMAAPWFFGKPLPLLGFCGGVLATMWVVGKLER